MKKLTILLIATLFIFSCDEQQDNDCDIERVATVIENTRQEIKLREDRNHTHADLTEVLTSIIKRRNEIILELCPYFDLKTI